MYPNISASNVGGVSFRVLGRSRSGIGICLGISWSSAHRLICHVREEEI